MKSNNKEPEKVVTIGQYMELLRATYPEDFATLALMQKELENAYGDQWDSAVFHKSEEEAIARTLLCRNLAEAIKAFNNIHKESDEKET